MSGDMMYDTSSGRYRLTDKYVFLFHQPIPPDTSGFSKFGKDAVLLLNALSTNKHLTSPEKYIIRHKKLFTCDSLGDIIRKRFGYSKRKQFIFFGQHWFKHRYYLKRVD